MPITNNIRPPVVDNYDDKSARQTRTAIQQIAASVASGKLLGRQILTGSGVYTPTTGTTTVRAFVISGGGGGGGAAAVGSISVGGGGASGTALDIVAISTSQMLGGAYSCGAGGAAGAAGANGGAGGDTTLTLNGQTYLAKGGGGGFGSTGNVGGFVIGLGGLPQSGSTGGVLASATQGLDGFLLNNATWLSGSGGELVGFGTGGNWVAGSSAGLPGQGFGAGGSGAAANNANQPGGAGSPGALVIYEYA